MEVVRLPARGLINQQICERLSISDRTVGHHLGHLYDKTGRRGGGLRHGTPSAALATTATAVARRIVHSASPP
ncbi:LuxR C-terminal-related transcriptional regulator [Streptomyces sp. NPDC023723]|uniref:LuxR C-terminal-related transcriptional regulator n=1 Tax=Streptomyces sp. NPDC023723 TaxID=3154323 RepID=UPI0033DFE057